jgi:hypothetical protein
LYCYDYKCDRCSFDAAAAYGAIGYYRFPDGGELHVLTTPAWCDQCETITIAEALPDIAFLRAELARYASGKFTDSDREAATGLSQSLDAFVASRRQSHANWISRFERRTIPGRCIECGFSDFRFLTSFTDDNTFPDVFVHPGCNGMMRMIRTCHASPATFFVLDGDGNRVTTSNTTEPCDEPKSR